jgi:hypothetical protein
MVALVINAAVPMQTEGFEAIQDGIDRSRSISRCIEVVDSQPPLPVMGAGVKITGKSGK